MDLFCEALIGYSEEEKKCKEVLRRFPRRAGELGMFPPSPSQGDRVVNPLDGMIYVYGSTTWYPIGTTNISMGAPSEPPGLQSDPSVNSSTMRASAIDSSNDGYVTIRGGEGVSLDSHTHSTPEPGILNPNLTSASIGPPKPVLSLDGVGTPKILTLDEVLNKKESFFIKIFKKVKQWIYLFLKREKKR